LRLFDEVNSPALMLQTLDAGRVEISTYDGT